MELTDLQRGKFRDYIAAPWGSRYGCQHPVKSQGLRRSFGKGLRVVLQCRICGRQGATIPWERLGLRREDVEALRLVDDEIGRQYQERFAAECAQRRQSEAESMAAVYASGWWRWALAKVRERSGGVCERCRERPMATAHHRRYLTHEGVRTGGEPLDWLVAVCRRCHQPGPDDKWQRDYHERGAPAGCEGLPQWRPEAAVE